MSRDSSSENKSDRADGKHTEAAGAHGKLLAEVSGSAISSNQVQEAKALAAGGMSCDSNWSKMVAQWVTKNEGGEKYLVYNPNDHGQGISVGLLQWNQKKGRLPDLLQAWHAQDPAKFNHMFGRHAAQMLRADSVRVADFNNDRALHNGMLAALADKEFQQVQAQLRSKHIVHSCEVAQEHDFKSLRGRAVVADLYNQIGETGTIRALNQVPRGPKESVRIEQLKATTGHRTHGEDRVASIEDKVKEVWRKLGSR